MTFHWEISEDIFKYDGRRREIFVPDTSLRDWESLLMFIAAQGYTLTYCNESQFELFKDGKQNLGHHLTLFLEGVALHCHFYQEHEIALDLDPDEVTDKATANQVYGFMRALAMALNKPVLLNYLNTRNSALLGFDPKHKGFLTKDSELTSAVNQLT